MISLSDMRQGRSRCRLPGGSNVCLLNSGSKYLQNSSRMQKISIKSHREWVLFISFWFSAIKIRINSHFHNFSRLFSQINPCHRENVWRWDGIHLPWLSGHKKGDPVQESPSKIIHLIVKTVVMYIFYNIVKVSTAKECLISLNHKFSPIFSRLFML